MVLEAVAVILGLLYLVLAIREQRSAWVSGGAASLLFLLLFWQASLPMQALLQVYYVLVSIHGFLHWSPNRAAATPRPHHASARTHLLYVAAWLVATGLILTLRAGADTLPVVLDSVTSLGGVLATWLVARKVLESWLYWIVIDLLSMLLYLQSGLYATAALYALYTILAYVGFREWRKHLKTTSTLAASA
ncbi:MAG: nicotinamide riboside transporter PnuC [Pseudomonadota bacterium]